MGGGHSVLSPSYGLGMIHHGDANGFFSPLSINAGVDNALQFTLVLASGEYVTANEYQYSDLFWALRGGGGGTYGVVVTVTYCTHDILPSAVITLGVNFSTPAIAQNVTADYFSILPELSDAGLGGSSLLFLSGIMAFNFATNISLAKANSTVYSFFERAHAVAGPQNVQAN
jgi:FAD/FMN-containing dehydrogenase